MTQALPKSVDVLDVPRAENVDGPELAGGRIPDRARPDKLETFTNITTYMRLAIQERPNHEVTLSRVGLHALALPSGRILMTSPLFQALFGSVSTAGQLLDTAREIAGDIFQAVEMLNFAPGLIVVKARKRPKEPHYYVLGSKTGDAALLTPMCDQVGDVIRRNSH